MKSVPHKCPICEGRCAVAKGFYPDDANRTECRACSGKGILWSWEITSTPYVPVPYPVPYPVAPRPIINPPISPYWWGTHTVDCKPLRDLRGYSVGELNSDVKTTVIYSEVSS